MSENKENIIFRCYSCGCEWNIIELKKKHNEKTNRMRNYCPNCNDDRFEIFIKP